MTLHFLNDVVDDVESTRLLISNLPGSALRMHVKSLGKPRDSTHILQAFPGKHDMERHSPSIL